MTREVFILGGKRTPMGEYVGALKDVSAIELGAIAARAALETTGVAPDEIDHTVIGNALQTSGDAIYGARHVALKAGIPFDRPALTVNRLCGSGIQSIVSGAQMIQLDEAGVCLVGGMESMSQAPHVIRGARWGIPLGEGRMEDSLWSALTDSYCNLNMAETAENLASRYGITRKQADAFALESQMRTKSANESARFNEEIVAVAAVLDRDEHPRPHTTSGALAELKPVFRKDGIVTAGNASGISDGAAAAVLTTAEKAATRGLKPLARLVSWGIAGCDPSMMGIGPVSAIKIALARAGLSLDQIDLFEINEAFACQYLAVEKELGLDRNRVNVNGGAIALGHPLGATGARLTATLIFELRRRNARFGIASACIGGGQGIALLVERM